jgi:hypothetical protein
LASALTLHMIALADLLDTADLPETAPAAPDRPRPAAGRPVEARLLSDERRYWIAAAAARAACSRL